MIGLGRQSFACVSSSCHSFHRSVNHPPNLAQAALWQAGGGQAGRALRHLSVVALHGECARWTCPAAPE